MTYTIGALILFGLSLLFFWGSKGASNSIDKQFFIHRPILCPETEPWYSNGNVFGVFKDVSDMTDEVRGSVFM